MFIPQAGNILPPQFRQDMQEQSELFRDIHRQFKNGLMQFRQKVQDYQCSTNNDFNTFSTRLESKLKNLSNIINLRRQNRESLEFIPLYNTHIKVHCRNFQSMLIRRENFNSTHGYHIQELTRQLKQSIKTQFRVKYDLCIASQVENQTHIQYSFDS